MYHWELPNSRSGQWLDRIGSWGWMYSVHSWNDFMAKVQEGQSKCHAFYTSFLRLMQSSNFLFLWCQLWRLLTDTYDLQGPRALLGLTLNRATWTLCEWESCSNFLKSMLSDSSKYIFLKGRLLAVLSTQITCFPLGFLKFKMEEWIWIVDLYNDA